jgi:hypothetical protein
MAYSESKDIGSDVKKGFIFLGLAVMVNFIASMALTSGRGFEDTLFLQKFLVYFIFGLIGVLATFGLIFYAKFNRKRGFQVPLHEPELSIFGSKSVFSNPLFLALIVFVIFFPVAFLAGTRNTFFSAIPLASQQVQVWANVVGDSLLPAFNENSLMLIPLIIMIWFFNRKKSGLNPFVRFIVIPVVFAGLWLLFHNLVYSGNDVASWATWLFGFVGAELTMIFYSSIPFAILHFTTNFVLSLKERGLYSNDLFLFELWAVYVIIVIFVFWLGFRIRKKRLKG